MSEEGGKGSFYVNLPLWLERVDFFRKAIDYLESEDCASGNLVAEARKKIDEAVELIAAAAKDNDKDKQDKVEGLVHDIMQAFFAMLDSCYDKYAGSRARGGGKA